MVAHKGREPGGLLGGGEGELGLGRTEEARVFQAEGAAWGRALGSGYAERSSFGAEGLG